MTPVPASAITIDDDPTNPTNALARRLRAHLQVLAALRVPITYRDLAKAMLLSPPHTIHQVTEALEQLMAEDAATDRPFIAAMVISKWRGGLPAPGFFDCAARFGRFAGDATGPEARVFYAGEFNASVALWARRRESRAIEQRATALAQYPARRRLQFTPDSVALMSLPGTLIEWTGAQQWWRTDAPADAVRSAAAHAGGHATLFRGLDKSAWFFTPLSAPLMAIHRRLKQSFEPAGIFNPGRLYADL